jgi:hypothetical protein
LFWSDVKNNGKTKKVAGVDLSSDCFLYTPDLANTASWMFPVLVRGNEPLTRNQIVMHLHNFDARTAALPEALRQELWDNLRGCAVTHGIRAERRVFAAKSEQAAEPTPTVQPSVKEKPLKRDRQTEEMLASADRMATAFLKSMGLD